jgi:hypothetical protein
MKSGFIPEGKTSDELIAGTERGGDLPPESDPDEGTDDGDAAPAKAGAEAVS